MLELKNRIGIQTTIPRAMTVREIVTSMERTYDSCAHDVDGEWCGSSVLDFVVSTNGQYAPAWDKDRYNVTARQIADEAILLFNRNYGLTE